MSIYHCSLKAISRKTGQSIVAASAYRHACKLENLRTGEIHDYSRKQGVDFSALYFPSGVNPPAWVQDRTQLWNAAEASEKRKDARLGRELVLALPVELTDMQRQELAEKMASLLANRYGLAVDVAIHQPNRRGDERNFHAHMLMSSRRITQKGFGEKARELDDHERGPAEVEHIRSEWARLANQALERAGQQVQIDHRSLKARGVKRMPTVHLGCAATAMERRGEPSRLGDKNRAAVRLNTEVRQIEEKLVNLQKAAEAARKAAEAARKAEEKRIARAEAERVAREKAEAERVAREKAEAERVAREKAEAAEAARKAEDAAPKTVMQRWREEQAQEGVKPAKFVLSDLTVEELFDPVQKTEIQRERIEVPQKMPQMPLEAKKTKIEHEHAQSEEEAPSMPLEAKIASEKADRAEAARKAAEPLPDYRAELAQLSGNALPRAYWKDAVREAWQKPFLDRIAADNENPGTVDECLRLARHDASPEGQAELKDMRRKLNDATRGLCSNGLKQMKLVQETMDRIRVTPDRQKTLAAELFELSVHGRQLGRSR